MLEREKAMHDHGGIVFSLYGLERDGRSRGINLFVQAVAKKSCNHRALKNRPN